MSDKSNARQLATQTYQQILSALAHPRTQGKAVDVIADALHTSFLDGWEAGMEDGIDQGREEMAGTVGDPVDA